MTAVSKHGRFFQLKFFNSLSIKSVTIYIPNESKIYVFNGNGNNSILAKDAKWNNMHFKKLGILVLGVNPYIWLWVLRFGTSRSIVS